MCQHQKDMKLNYKQKIFAYFVLVFICFTTGIVFFEQQRERAYKENILQSNQDIYTHLIHTYIEMQQISLDSCMTQIKYVDTYLPDNARVTIIAADGRVLYDNDIQDSGEMENHLLRPEIRTAAVKGTGSNIRQSSSIDKEYLYFAKRYDDYFVRVALPYDLTIQNFLKSDYMFLCLIIVLFFITLLALAYLSNRFGESISALKDFTYSAQNDTSNLDEISFPDDELGAIGDKIVDLYKQIKRNKQKIAIEREKLLQHFQHTQEGVCFFSKKQEKIYANSHFIQYLNLIADNPTLNANQLFEEPSFKQLQDSSTDIRQSNISKNGKHFNLQLIRFDDGSFEITINDITKLEKTRLMKQTITSNIAHDLRTPVTSIRGYLETLKEQPHLPEEKRLFFIERAFSQIVRLSDLIRDISLITRMEEASDMFEREMVAIRPILSELQEDLSDKLEHSLATVTIKVSNEVQVKGNRTLLYSIFRNLMDNSLFYGGQNISIIVDNYMEDEQYYYFSFSDTGIGVEERHLHRIFERFYRIHEGRTTDTGGSGLGLSIVKNAVLFHKGEIVAKNKKGGGLEFLFMLHK